MKSLHAFVIGLCVSSAAHYADQRHPAVIFPVFIGLLSIIGWVISSRMENNNES